MSAHDNCKRLHWYQSIAKCRASAVPANLAFGKAIDLSTRSFLLAVAQDLPLPDCVDLFRKTWNEQRSQQPLSFAASQTPEQLETSGVDLMRALPGAWEETGLTVAVDGEGRPMVDVSLQADLGVHDGVEVEFNGIIDVMVYDSSWQLAVMDVKSSSAPHSPLYTMRSDQLTSYQLLLEANRGALELPPLARLGFWDLLKRKNTSRFEPPVFAPVRSAEELREFRQKLFWIAQDIRDKRFPKSSRMQFNTPCEMCDFAQHCVYGDEEGLEFRAPRKVASA